MLRAFLAFRLAMKSTHTWPSAQSGFGKGLIEATRGGVDALASIPLVFLGGLGANLAGVLVVFGRGAVLAGVPIWQGWTRYCVLAPSR